MVSWASEEYGIAGSYEWVSHHTVKLMNRAVGLVNTDICVSGPIAKPQASPVLKDSVKNALKMADDPTTDNGRKYYEFWEEWTNKDHDDVPKEPRIGLLGSGSDHASFAFYANIPAVNLRFKDDSKAYPGIGQYPTYHTGYETFYLMEKLIDPGFKIHRTCAQTSIHVLLELADSAVLPYNLERFPKVMAETLDSFDTNNVTDALRKGGVTLKHIKDAVKEFSNATKSFMDELKTIQNEHDPMKLRIANDQMMQLERIFNLPSGLPGI